MLLATSLLTGLVDPAPALGYSKDNHRRLTQAAVRLVEACRSKLGLETQSPAAHTELLVHYNVAQDSLRRKLVLWHFPARPERDPREGACPAYVSFCALVGSRTLDPWYEELWRRVRPAAPAAVVYPALGAALHYVQDLAVPAHAIPIFHPTRDLPATDAFDDYDGWRDFGEATAPAELAAVCDALRAPSSPLQLIRDVRAQTLASLEAPLEASPSGRTWSTFWSSARRDPRDASFGEYGCGRFGKTQFECAGVRYQVSETTYSDFASERARAAIIASAALIVLYQRQLRPARPNEEPTSAVFDNPYWSPSRRVLRELIVR